MKGKRGREAGEGKPGKGSRGREAGEGKAGRAFEFVDVRPGEEHCGAMNL